MEKGHGRIETRKIAVSREVVPYLAWPGLAQVARIERRREIARSTSEARENFREDRANAITLVTGRVL